MTNWELVGLGMLGEGAQGSNAEGSQGNQSLHSWQCVSETVGLSHSLYTHTHQVTATQVPLCSRAEL